jgi:MoxR-like ATPase
MGHINQTTSLKPIIDVSQIMSARKVVDQIHLADNIQDYIVSIILATRFPKDYNLNNLKQLITFGASPRATIFMAIASKSQAFMNNRAYVIPEDVRSVGRAILRHRIILSYEAEAEEITTEEIITQIFDSIPTP